MTAGGWRRLVTWIGPALLVATVSGCSSSAVPSAGSAPPTNPSSLTAPVPAVPSPPPIAWSVCPSMPTLQCGTVPVPVDYQHAQGASLRLAVSRAPALDPSDVKGTLVFNPGGPGESGNLILPVALSLVPATIRREFNIVGFDPRGTGSSDPLRCGTSPSQLASVLPLPAAAGQPLPGTPAFTAMAKACAPQPNLPFIDTVDTARDMDRIRQAMGLATISFYGLSYGTVLGAVYAELFPHRIDTMVLDGAVDVNASLTQQAEEEAPAAEQSLNHLFATCTAQGSCPLGPDPTAFFTALATSFRAHPLPAPGSGDTYPVTEGDLDTATLFALSLPESTSNYIAALVAAHQGNGAPLRALSLEFETDTNGAPLVDALWAITCNDAAVHPSPVEAGNLARALNARLPLMGAYAATYTMGGCVAWPSGRQPVVDVHPRHTPPILVIGNTGDPNTPYVGGRHLAAAIPSARLLTWKGWGHTWLLSGFSDTCMQQRVTTYLTGGGLPPVGAVCK